MVSESVAISVAKAPTKRRPAMNLDHIDLDNSAWARSSFQRIKFVRGMRTTGKTKVPESLPHLIDDEL